MGSSPESEEELRAARVAATVGHAQCAAEVLSIVRIETLTEDGITGPSAAISFGAATLCHEVAQDAVEGQSVEILCFRQTDEVTNGLWGLIFKQLQHDLATRCIDLNLREQLLCLRLTLFSANFLFLGPGFDRIVDICQIFLAHGRKLIGRLRFFQKCLGFFKLIVVVGNEAGEIVKSLRFAGVLPNRFQKFNGSGDPVATKVPCGQTNQCLGRACAAVLFFDFVASE